MRHEEAHPQFFEKPLQTEVNQIVLEIFQKFFVEKDIFEFYMGHNLLFWSTEKKAPNYKTITQPSSLFSKVVTIVNRLTKNNLTCIFISRDHNSSALQPHLIFVLEFQTSNWNSTHHIYGKKFYHPSCFWKIVTFNNHSWRISRIFYLCKQFGLLKGVRLICTWL